MFSKKKSNWLIVCHTWHVSDMGFYDKLLVNASEQQAQAEAALFAEKYRGMCCAAKAKAFLLPDTIALVGGI